MGVDDCVAEPKDAYALLTGALSQVLWGLYESVDAAGVNNCDVGESPVGGQRAGGVFVPGPLGHFARLLWQSQDIGEWGLWGRRKGGKL